jgi:hypothetical protein
MAAVLSEAADRGFSAKMDPITDGLGSGLEDQHDSKEGAAVPGGRPRARRAYSSYLTGDAARIPSPAMGADLALYRATGPTERDVGRRVAGIGHPIRLARDVAHLGLGLPPDLQVGYLGITWPDRATPHAWDPFGGLAANSW